MSKTTENKIADLIAGDITALGYDLVRVQITGGGKYAALQIMAERHDGAGMTVDDCAKISKMISAQIESADSEFADRFDLEVSSPGIDRPLVNLKDYERYCGHVAKVELGAPLNGRKKLQGKIVKVAGNDITLQIDKDTFSVDFGAIEKAKLVLTDELLKAAARGQITH